MNSCPENVEQAEKSYSFEEFLKEFGSVKDCRATKSDDTEDAAEQLAIATLSIFENALSGK